MADVKRAKIKLDVENGFSVNSDEDIQEVLKSLTEMIQSGTHNGVEVEIQYLDETEVIFTDEEEAEDEEEEDEAEEEAEDEDEEDEDEEDEDEEEAEDDEEDEEEDE
ncbi:AAA family ATPase, partial [Bacillus paramycoides]